MSTRTKLIAALLLFTAWGVFAACGMTPVADFITGVRDALIGLGVFQAVIINPSGPTAPKE